MYALDHISVEKSESIDRELLTSTFGEILTLVVSSAQNVRDTTEEVSDEVAKPVLVQLELFIVLCNKWMRSRKIDKNGKILIRQSREIAHFLFTDVSKRMERELGKKWAELPLERKTTDRELAEKWVRLNLVENLDDVFVELSTEQQRDLEKARKRWEKTRAGYAPTHKWADGPLLGRYREK